MRNHGWQLPYHALQVVAMAVFLALGFAFYVFFAPFVGKQLYQFILMGFYTPLLISSFGLYIWCAAADPSDPGVFRSKKYLNIPNNKELTKLKDTKHGGVGEFNSSFFDGGAGDNASDKGKIGVELEGNGNTWPEKKDSSLSCYNNRVMAVVATLLPCSYICKLDNKSSVEQSEEDGMFYCSLCEVEVFKYSKHCRVYDKCVDHFDHHCRWLNNCIGKQNYRKFFALMVSSLILLVFQWSTGILVLILCFLERKQFASDISSNLGSSFTVVPFVIVVAVFTVLAMIATLPLAQLFFFHILLIKKGISTYDYIIALREREQEQEQEQQATGDQQSPRMSPVSSLNGLSSVSSFHTFNRASAWCTPPQFFVEDQFDAVPPDSRSVSSLGKKTTTSGEQMTKKKNPAPVKISPWTLARLNAEDVSKVAAEARKRSKVLRPVPRHELNYMHETDSSLGSSNRRMPDNKRLRLPIESQSKLPGRDHQGTTAATLPSIVSSSSSESSLDYSPDVRHLGATLSARSASHKDIIPLSRSTSDGYDASGGEDSDRVPTRIVHRSSDWRSLPFGLEPGRSVGQSVVPWSNQRRH